MAKEFDICIRGGCTDFDVCLNNRTTGYDIIVRSLPFHYNMTAKSGIALGYHMKNPVLHHFMPDRQMSAIALGGRPGSGQLKKHESASNLIGLSSHVKETVRKFSDPIQSAIQIDANLDTTGKRRRMLSEMDGDALAVYDEMTLKDVDFVILP